MACPAPSKRSTGWRVRAVDRLTSVVITGGGITVIIAILGICVFLMWVVLPLFGSARISKPLRYALPAAAAGAEPLFFDLDEYRTQGLVLYSDGRLCAFDAASGELLSGRNLLPSGRRLTAHARTLQGGYSALGLDDGTVMLGRIGFQTEFVENHSTTQSLVTLGPPISINAVGSAVAALDYQVQTAEQRVVKEALAVLTDNQSLFLAVMTRKKDLLTGVERTTPRLYSLPFVPREMHPHFLLLNEQCSGLYLAWDDGELWRYELHNPAEARVVEKLDLVADQRRRLADLKFLIGTRSLVAGDTGGGVNVWFTVEDKQARAGGDGLSLVAGHVLEAQAAPVTAIAASTRNRCFISADAAGSVVLRHATSERTLGSFRTPDAAALVDCRIAPKADAVAGLDSAGRFHVWELNNPHPETTFSSLFGRVWYEGDDRPAWTWQSSGGSDDFEPKLSLTPLIFGTLKATVYSLTFAVPIALLAAVYTSQFLQPRRRNVVKPAIEMMASLPSVVLGFVAALVLAPVVENNLTAVLALAVVTPFMLLLAGYVFQLAPPSFAVRLSSGMRLAVALALVAVSLILSDRLSGPLERFAFSGDIKAWLDGRLGSPAPLWAVLFFPVLVPVALICCRRWIRPRLQAAFRLPTSLSEGMFELLNILLVLAMSAGVSAIFAAALTTLGFDLRDDLAGTYVQRNTLVVGFVMGFAVIPIIYTIAEDALSGVPEHLKAGSLACGASQWQTTLRVVLPIAASGIYSAVLIGLGRAVGETMIVVMAAGNTAIIDLSPFTGLRALSANIAVELPEAVKDGTLYRVLFLAGLVLFLMTFLINTLAEVIRLRLRRRAGDL